MEDIGRKIRELRQQKGMTLEERGNRVGVGKSTVLKWESGAIENMRRDKIARLADALGVSPLGIMGMDKKKPSNISVPAAHGIPILTTAIENAIIMRQIRLFCGFAIPPYDNKPRQIATFMLHWIIFSCNKI